MPDQPWQKIRSFGNVLRHEYDAIREDRLFEIVQLNVPGLLTATKDALHRWDIFKEP
jgi:uncharacterized protein with HEPN domain